MRVLGVIAVAIAAVLFTFALPVEEWRTGDQGLAPLDSVPEAATPPFPRRVWIDTDAACGHSPRTDPDDCFAIALLLRSPEIEVIGISIVAGNAPRELWRQRLALSRVLRLPTCEPRSSKDRLRSSRLAR